MSFDRSRLPTGADYFASQGLTLKGQGVWRDSVCFFHDDTKPSLRVKADSGAYRCMVCGEHGSNILDLHMKRTGLNFVRAAKELGAWL
jgi:DNA primase